jgi:hypothetical protein
MSKLDRPYARRLYHNWAVSASAGPSQDPPALEAGRDLDLDLDGALDDHQGRVGLQAGGPISVSPWSEGDSNPTSFRTQET